LTKRTHRWFSLEAFEDQGMTQGANAVAGHFETWTFLKHAVRPVQQRGGSEGILEEIRIKI